MPSPNVGPSGPPQSGETSPSGQGGPGGSAVYDAMHAEVRTLGELKKALIKNLGEHDGMKLYNSFMKSFALAMLAQMQQTAARAKKAAQQMRNNE